MTAVGGWKLFARCIASSFLFLAGVSLFLAHGDGIRWRGFWKRLRDGGRRRAGDHRSPPTSPYRAASSSSASCTRSRWPACSAWPSCACRPLLTLIAAGLVVAAPHYLRSGLLRSSVVVVDGPFGEQSALQRLRAGVSMVRRGACRHRRGANSPRRPDCLARLAGLHAGRWCDRCNLRRPPQPRFLPHPPAGAHRLRLGCSRRSCRRAGKPAEVQFLNSCQAACEDTRDTEFCTRYCACMLDPLEQDKSIEGVYAGDQSHELRSRVEQAADDLHRGDR